MALNRLEKAGRNPIVKEEPRPEPPEKPQKRLVEAQMDSARKCPPVGVRNRSKNHQR